MSLKKCTSNVRKSKFCRTLQNFAALSPTFFGRMFSNEFYGSKISMCLCPAWGDLLRRSFGVGGWAQDRDILWTEAREEELADGDDHRLVYLRRHRVRTLQTGHRDFGGQLVHWLTKDEWAAAHKIFNCPFALRQKKNMYNITRGQKKNPHLCLYWRGKMGGFNQPIAHFTPFLDRKSTPKCQITQ